MGVGWRLVVACFLFLALTPTFGDISQAQSHRRSALLLAQTGSAAGAEVASQVTAKSSDLKFVMLTMLVLMGLLFLPDAIFMAYKMYKGHAVKGELNKLAGPHEKWVMWRFWLRLLGFIGLAVLTGVMYHDMITSDRAFLIATLEWIALMLFQIVATDKVDAALGTQQRWSYRLIVFLMLLPVFLHTYTVNLEANDSIVVSMLASYFLVLMRLLYIILRRSVSSSSNLCDWGGETTWKFVMPDECVGYLFLDVTLKPSNPLDQPSWTGIYSCMVSGDNTGHVANVRSYRLGHVDSGAIELHSQIAGSVEQANPDQLLLSGLLREAEDVKYTQLRAPLTPKSIIITMESCNVLRVEMLQERLSAGAIVDQGADTVEVMHRFQATRVAGECVSFVPTGKWCSEALKDLAPEPSSECQTELSGPSRHEGYCQCATGMFPVTCEAHIPPHMASCKRICESISLPKDTDSPDSTDSTDSTRWVTVDPEVPALPESSEELTQLDSRIFTTVWTQIPVKLDHVLSPSHFKRHERDLDRLKVTPFNPVKMKVESGYPTSSLDRTDFFATRFDVRYSFQGDSDLEMKLIFFTPQGMRMEFDYTSTFCSLESDMFKGYQVLDQKRETVSSIKATVQCGFNEKDEAKRFQVSCERGRWSKILPDCTELSKTDGNFERGKCPPGYTPFNNNRQCCLGELDYYPETFQSPCKRAGYEDGVLPCPWVQGCFP